MHDLSASELLEIWERAAGATPAEQALVILAAVHPQASWDDLAGLTVRDRDQKLFQLRVRTFGSHFAGLAECPACHERLELAFEAGELQVRGLLTADETTVPEVGAGAPESPSAFIASGVAVRYRLPTSADLLEALSLPDAASARRALLGACMVSLEQKGRPITLEELPPKALRAIVERIGKAAALADLTVACTCPACGKAWEIVFDIVSYFWNEIAAWAVRMLHEVHLLASAYGWREADILAMSAWRRQRYLELIGA